MFSIIKDAGFVNYGICVVEVEVVELVDVVGSGVSGVVVEVEVEVELVVWVGSGEIVVEVVVVVVDVVGSGEIVVEVVEVVELVEVVGSRVVEVEVVEVVEVVVGSSHGSQGDDREQGETQHSTRPVSGFVTG